MPKKKRVEEEEEVYHVEVITKARVNEDGDWEYHVKWAGYASDADSWEPAENVKQCDRLLTSFWKHVGTDDNDYPVGYETAAKEDWIGPYCFTTRFLPYSESFSQIKKAIFPGDICQVLETKERRKSKSTTSLVSESTADDSRSLDEESSAKTTAGKRLNRKALVVDTDSESESDGHPGKQVKAAKASTPPSKEILKVPAQVKRHELPVATGSSASIAPPKVTAVRTHQDQRTNPLVKPMKLPSKSVEAGSSLSTKQRVAAGILPPPGPKPLLHVPKKPLPALSFKKNKPLNPPSIQTKDTASSISVATPTSPVVQTPTVTNDAEIVASPQPMDTDHLVDPWGSISDDAGLPSGSSDNFTVPIPLKSQEEINADMFLQTVHLPVEVPVVPDQSDQPTMKLIKIPVIPKIPKKWKWSGDLFISTSENKTELLCAVTIADPSGTSNTSHINLLLSSLDSLRISRLYPVVELSPLLRACGKPQYFGTLESSEPNEDVVIHGLEHHLTSEGLAVAIPLLLDATEVAVLVVFPGAQQKMTKVLQVPEQLSGAPLLVVLLPFLVAAITSTNVAGQRSIEAVIQSSFNTQDVLVPHEPPQEALLYQAMSLLCFPKVLLDFLNSSTRTYCIWPSPDQMLPGLATIMLQYVLKSTKAVSAKLEEDTRVVFISNQHLEMLHTMPSLVTKLANSPETQFWTYGYSANIACQQWKLQEIYPLGGVVTFTSSALAEDLVGCYQLMSQIIEHPLWDCYLIPEVLAVSHLLCSNGGLGSSSESCLSPIMDLINLGLISVIKMPEKGHSNQMAWLPQILGHSNASGLELLEVYLGDLRSHSTTSDMTTEQLITFTNHEITRDLSSAQIQPAFMENYRRFVVIRAASEDTKSFDKDGLEWSSISLFKFNDGYFQP
ncbi:hypothetical protein JVT61DRAFT_5811 [Boletus reticuloceps]|uniref:Chromo domain-containing protein n=1 Tax=Boletus reticuloceps TaxID=495285 RepID=A0A8I2Z2V9_9AGAM|nr:hypothetical protein JVT61DRAFT_5811 [Boletus reticuloceps]